MEFESEIKKKLLPYLKYFQKGEGCFVVTMDTGTEALREGTRYLLFPVQLPPAMSYINENESIVFCPHQAYYGPRGSFFVKGTVPGQKVQYSLNQGLVHIQSELQKWCGWERLSPRKDDALEGQALEGKNRTTFHSLLDFLKQRKPVSAQEAQQILQQLQEEKLSKKEFMLYGLSSLDAEQDEIMRKPVGMAIVLDGLPGSGKTTTAIKLLAKHCFHNAEGERLARPLSWLYIVPNEILKDYIQEAFNRENIPAAKESILSWPQVRLHLLVDVFEIIGPQRPIHIINTPDASSEKAQHTADDWARKTDFDAWQEQVKSYWDKRSLQDKKREQFLSQQQAFLAQAAIVLGKDKTSLGRTITNLSKTDIPARPVVPVDELNEVQKALHTANEIDLYSRALQDTRVQDLLQKAKPFFQGFYNKYVSPKGVEISAYWNYLAPEAERVEPDAFAKQWESLCVWMYICGVLRYYPHLLTDSDLKMEFEVLGKEGLALLETAGCRYLQHLREMFPPVEEKLFKQTPGSWRGTAEALKNAFFPFMEDAVPSGASGFKNKFVLGTVSVPQTPSKRLIEVYQMGSKIKQFPSYKHQLTDFLQSAFRMSVLGEQAVVTQEEFQKELQQCVDMDSPEINNLKHQLPGQTESKKAAIKQNINKERLQIWKRLSPAQQSALLDKAYLGAYTSVVEKNQRKILQEQGFIFQWAHTLFEKIRQLRNSPVKGSAPLQRIAHQNDVPVVTRNMLPVLCQLLVLKDFWQQEIAPSAVEVFHPYEVLLKRVEALLKEQAPENRLGALDADALTWLLVRAGVALKEHFAEEYRPLLTKLQKYSYHKIIVDEATDFSPVQIKALAALSPNGLLMCGDLMQRTTKFGTSNWQELQSLGFFYKELLIGYRQNPHLLTVANQLYNFVNHTQKHFISAFPPGDYPYPEYTGQVDFSQAIDFIIRKISSIYQQHPSISVFVPDAQTRRQYAQALQDGLPFVTVRECENGQTGLPNEIRIVTYDSIKGLEFEETFLVGLDQLDKALCDKFLYLALTRATRNLYIVGDLPDILREAVGNFETYFKKAAAK